MNATAPRLLLSAALACGLLWAAPAEARFGKASAPEKSEKGPEKKGQKAKQTRAQPDRGQPVRAERGPPGHRASPATRPAPPPSSRPAPPPSRSHAASPVYSPRPAPSAHHDHDHYDDGSCYAVYPAPRPRYRSTVIVANGGGAHVHTHAREEHDHALRLHHLELMGSVQPAPGAAMVGVGMLVDWSRFGMELRVDHLAFAPEEAGLPSDRVTLVDAALTLKLLGNDRSRLRGHLGVSSAFAPDATFVGPYGGVSATARVLGPLTMDASAQLTLVPYTRLDTRAGLGLRFGVVEVRGGMRLLVLDDQGRVDGVRHTDALVGPYLAAGLVF